MCEEQQAIEDEPEGEIVTLEELGEYAGFFTEGK